MCKAVGLYSNSQIHLAKMFNSSKADALRNWEERKKKKVEGIRSKGNTSTELYSTV